jgi:hypothetical protein
VAEALAGAHLHFIAWSANDACFMLHEGVNLMMYVKKLAGLPDRDPDPAYGYDYGREEREFERDHEFERARELEREREPEREHGYDHEQYPYS